MFLHKLRTNRGRKHWNKGFGPDYRIITVRKPKEQYYSSFRLIKNNRAPLARRLFLPCPQSIPVRSRCKLSHYLERLGPAGSICLILSFPQYNHRLRITELKYEAPRLNSNSQMLSDVPEPFQQRLGYQNCNGGA